MEAKIKLMVVVVVVVLIGFMSCSCASIFDVGGVDGWVQNPSETYTHWAMRNRFQISDTLGMSFSFLFFIHLVFYLNLFLISLLMPSFLFSFLFW